MAASSAPKTITPSFVAGRPKWKCSPKNPRRLKNQDLVRFLNHFCRRFSPIRRSAICARQNALTSAQKSRRTISVSVKSNPPPSADFHYTHPSLKLQLFYLDRKITSPPTNGVAVTTACKMGRGARLVNFAPTKEPMTRPRKVWMKTAISRWPFIIYPALPASEIGKITSIQVPTVFKSETPKNIINASWINAVAPMPKAPERKPVTTPVTDPSMSSSRPCGWVLRIWIWRSSHSL